MSFPDRVTNPIAEWLIGGVWTDLSSRVRSSQGIDISRGRQNEQGTISPTRALCLMNNLDSTLSNRNPLSPYFRKIPTGTQVRYRAGNGDNCMYMRFNTFADAVETDDFTSVRCPDAAPLDITGDLEVRVDIEPHSWRPAARTMVLASKYLIPSDQRSWLLRLDRDGFLRFIWTTAGTVATRIEVVSTVAVPATSGRLALKVTLDVDNGAAGNTVRFFTAPSISGTYTQLGANVVTAGVTSVFAGTARVVLGGGDNDTRIFSGGMGFGGRLYGFQLYSGIAGTLVADPDFSAWSLGSTSLADTKGNTWTVSGQARITSPRVRFWGELTSVAQKEDSSAREKYVPVEASDLLQRLGSGRVAANSPMYLNVIKRSGLLGYWPLEDGAGSTGAASAVRGVGAGAIRAVNFGLTDGLPGTKQHAELSTQLSKIVMRPKKGTGTGVISLVWVFKMGATLPASDSTFVQFLTTGNARSISFTIAAAGFDMQFKGVDGTTVIASSPITFGTGVNVVNEWLAMRLLMTQSGGNVNWEWAWYQQGKGALWGTSGTYAGTVGYVTSVTPSAATSATYAGSKIAHFAVAESDLGGFRGNDLTWANAIEAYAGERAAARVDRVARQAGVYCEITGKIDSSALMGAQPVDTPLNVMLDAAKTDGGFLTGLRDAYGLGYRTRQDLERHLDASLTYGLHLSETPDVIDDDQAIVNAMTASRPGGSSAYAEITDGPNGISDPPNGVGYRPGGADFNAFKDKPLADLANMTARYRSFDSPRVPNLSVALHRGLTHPSTAVGLSVAWLDVGDTVGVSSWPSQNAPDRLLFLAQGYDERLVRYLWDVRFNVSTAGPLTTGLYGVPEQAAGKQRYGSADSTLSAGVTASATTVVIATTTTPWTTVSARYPLDIMMGGERITLNSPPGGSTSPQTFTGVTRAVNGISKAQVAGEKILLAQRTFYGLGAQ